MEPLKTQKYAENLVQLASDFFSDFLRLLRQIDKPRIPEFHP